MTFTRGGSGRPLPSQSSLPGPRDRAFLLEHDPMSRSIDIDTIFAEDRSNPPKEWCLPWCETKGAISVVVEPKPHWAEDLWVFRLDEREYSLYADWLADACRARFYGHIDTCGADLLLKARTMLAREIAEGLWDEVA